ncbi:predicted protein [Uncinocarpus reesii 1704]|uniref:CSN8/PSMD8/EIF3K domain-containing protein n=1 Tax=Uncinocarpus reesii (strain UAMH 1704) TaxID=336963 RepID=C4JIH6_UNCRE|nr:uncharacterized protein UREG_01513 [Uncinocarpus reesii 1704]EEP76664.1 predicted protein [Uncinocarpus reesii 1704]
MLDAPRTLEELQAVLTSAPSATALLDALMDAEGEICLQSDDTALLQSYYSAYLFALLLRDELTEARMLNRRIPRSLTSADTALETHFRDRTLEDLSLAYGALRPETAASYLGFDIAPPSTDAMEDVSSPTTSEIIEILVQRGWEYDSATNLLKPIISTSVAGDPELDQVKIGQLAALLGTHGG